MLKVTIAFVSIQTYLRCFVLNHWLFPWPHFKKKETFGLFKGIDFGTLRSFSVYFFCCCLTIKEWSAQWTACWCIRKEGSFKKSGWKFLGFFLICRLIPLCSGLFGGGACMLQFTCETYSLELLQDQRGAKGGGQQGESKTNSDH